MEKFESILPERQYELNSEQIKQIEDYELKEGITGPEGRPVISVIKFKIKTYGDTVFVIPVPLTLTDGERSKIKDKGTPLFDILREHFQKGEMEA